MTAPAGATYYASVSGGKDSTAMALYLQEQGIEHTPIFMDTGWESSWTYEHLQEYLPQHLGPITWIRATVELPESVEPIAQDFEHRLGHYSAMVRLILRKGMFPSRQRRFCTQTLKLFTIRDWIEAQGDDEAVSVVGIRGAESAARALMPEWEMRSDLDFWTWRPLHAWSEDDVIAIHRRHGVLPNPHYLSGSTRVGCWPCIHSRKAEIRALARRDPERVALLADLERVVGDLAEARAKDAGTTLKARGHVRPTWFQSRADDRRVLRCEACGGTGASDEFEEEACGVGLFPSVSVRQQCPECEGRGERRTKGSRGTMWPIDRVVSWATEEHSPELFAPGFQEQGCMRWGLCDYGPGAIDQALARKETA